jgi:hypothetical protein
VIDCFIQGWNVNKGSSEVLDLYKNFKNVFGYEAYLDILPSSLRCYITRLRISAHALRIQTGRYARNRIPRNERYCQCCHSLD